MNKMTEWNVFVDPVGHIGTVHETTEEAARCAALYKYGEEGSRPTTGTVPSPHIYDDDTFSVSQR